MSTTPVLPMTGTLTADRKSAKDRFIEERIRPEDIEPIPSNMAVIDLNAIPKGGERKESDSYEYLKEKVINSLGADGFAAQQWKVAESYIWTTSDRRGKAAEMTTASFGTIGSLLEALSDMDDDIDGYWEGDEDGDLLEDIWSENDIR